MVHIPSRMADCFIASSAERTLVLGTAIAALFATAFVVSGTIEDVLHIPNGVGFLQNYGLIAAILGDAILFYLVSRYFECCREVSKLNHFGGIKGVRSAYMTLLRRARLKSEYKFILYIFSLIGMIALSGNIGLHFFGNLKYQWTSVVFDDLGHPLSFLTNRLFSIYSWMILLPICGYFTLIGTLFLSEITDLLEKSRYLKYDLLNSDNCGGFSDIKIAISYFNIGITVLYTQISLYAYTFSHMNDFQILAYVITTAFLLFGNFFIFGKINRMISRKLRQALDEKKRQAYSGDHLNFEIMKYYVDVYSKRSLERRLAILTISLKSVAIAIPPILKGLLLVS